MLILLLGLASTAFLVILILYAYFYLKRIRTHQSKDIESSEHKHEDILQKEDLIIFQGGEDLTICDILDAPGEVIGKSNYGTLYKALLQRSNQVRLLRFLRPVCITRAEELDEVIQLLGGIRHPNLVPLLGFYTGPRGEKLFVHPFYRRGNLAQFIRGDSHVFPYYSPLGLSCLFTDLLRFSQFLFCFIDFLTSGGNFFLSNGLDLWAGNNNG